MAAIKSDSVSAEASLWVGAPTPRFLAPSETPLSRFLDIVRESERQRSAPGVDWDDGPRPFRVVTVTSNKGGVGKTTIAANLAVFVRALREDLPVLVVGFDDQLILDQMFALSTGSHAVNVASAIRMGSLNSAIRLGQYGVHYIPSSEDLPDLKRAIEDPFRLQRVLMRTGWQGLVVIDTKSDLEILTQNALAASDLAIVVVADRPSLRQAERVYELMKGWGRPLERARVLLSMVDLRIKYDRGQTQDVLGLLVSEIRRRGFPLFESFLSRSPLIASLYTNPDGQMQSILHGAEKSIVRRQMQHIAEDVLRLLESFDGPLPVPGGGSAPVAEAATNADVGAEPPAREVDGENEEPSLETEENLDAWLDSAFERVNRSGEAEG